MIEKLIKREFKEYLEEVISDKDMGKPFRSPKNFSNWKDEVLVYKLKSLDPYTQDKISNYAINVTRSLVYYKFPTYYVSRDLAIALWNTVSDLKIEDLNIALPAVNFMIPYQTIMTPEGDSVTSVGVASVRKCETLKHIRDVYGDGLIGCTGFIKNQLNDSYWYGTYHKKSYIPEQESIYEEYLEENDLRPQLMSDMDEKTFMSKFRSFIYNLMFILEKRPELIYEEREKQKGFGKPKNKTEYRNPIWLGKNYKIKYKTSKDTQEKEGNPKSPHFRKGHLRRQRFGKGGENVKLIWVDPVIVNAKKD